MGKYSAPAEFAGQKKRTGPGQGKTTQQAPKKLYPPIDWSRVDVVTEIERHTSTRLRSNGKQFVGACPYDDCLVDDDGFIVWPELSKRGQHFFCRGCHRTGDLINLLSEIKGWTFLEAKKELGLLDDEDQAPRLSFQSPARQRQAQRDDRDREELAMLQHLYPRMRAALAKYQRPQAYLAERGVSLEQAQRFGLGYIPFASEVDTGRELDEKLRRWQGRIIFPLSSPNDEGVTFAGRTLQGWQRGISPAGHKLWIDGFNAQLAPDDKRRIVRVLKTSPCGHFGYREATGDDREQLVIVEGEFDALSLLIAGVEGVIAMGTGFATDLIPMSVESVILATDTDGPGKRAAHQLALALAAAGLETSQILPSSGKDWNDMWSAGHAAEIATLFGVGHADQVGQGVVQVVQDRQEGRSSWSVGHIGQGERGGGQHRAVSGDTIGQALQLEIDQIRTYAQQLGRQRLYWSVQYSGFVSEELTTDQYCLSLYTCLHQSNDRDRFYAALDELAWMQTYLRLQLAQPGARLAVSVFDQELANLKARLLELVQEKDTLPSPSLDPLREYADTCASCGARVDQADTEFHYTPTGALFCREHYLGWLAAQPLPHKVDAVYADEALARAQEKREASMSKERFVEIAQRLANAIPGGCEVHIDPPGYTIEDRAREVAQEIRKRQLERESMTSTTPEEYWAKVRARLGDFVADVPAEMLAHAQRPRTYSAPFPKLELQLGDDGRYHLATVGMWDPAITFDDV